MKIRNTIPEYGNKFYNTTSNGGFSLCIKGKPTQAGRNVLSNCVGYACGRFNEIIGSMKYPYLNCNAENFIERAKQNGLKISNVPTLGGIMVWQKGSTLNSKDGAGHVAIVERIDNSNQIYTSESAYNSTAFYNVTRRNDNGRWGMNSNYKFRGCIVNPAIVEKKYDVGLYKTLANMYVREGAGRNYRIKNVKELTPDGQKHVVNPTGPAIYRKDTRFTAKEIIKTDSGYWAKTPSGFVCLELYGKQYCVKV